MNKLLAVILFFLPFAGECQISFQIQQSSGATAALRDPSSEVVDSALAILFRSGGLDNLRFSVPNDMRLIEHCENGLSVSDGSSGYLQALYVRVLLAQDKISEQDVNLIAKWISNDENEDFFLDAFVVGGTIIDDEFGKALSKKLQKHDKAQIVLSMVLLRNRNTMDESQIDNVLANLWLENFISNGKSYGKILRFTDAILRIRPISSGLMKLADYLLQINDEKVRQKFENILMGAIRRNFNDVGLKDLYASLVTRTLHDTKAVAAIRMTLKINLSADDSAAINNIFIQSDCATKKTMIEMLTLKHLEFAIYELIKLIDDVNCQTIVSWLNTLDGIVVSDPWVFSHMQSRLTGNSEKAFAGICYLLQQKKLNKPELALLGRLVDRLMTHPEEAATLNMGFEKLNEDAIQTIELQGEGLSNPRLVNFYLSVLVHKNRLTDGDMDLLHRVLWTLPDSMHMTLIWNLADRHMDNERVMTSLLGYLKTFTKVEQAWLISQMPSHQNVPLNLWPLLVKIILSSENFSENLYSSSPMPLGTWYLVADRMASLDKRNLGKFRTLLYFQTSGRSDILSLLEWVGKPERACDPNNMNGESKLTILQLFDSTWESIDSLRTLRGDIAAQVSAIVGSMSNRELKRAIEPLHHLLTAFTRDAGLQNYSAFLAQNLVKVENPKISVWDLVAKYWLLILLHAFFWSILIALYPRSTRVQSIFFWNEQVRKWAGLGYVNLLLLHVPFLRHIILSPFVANLREGTEMSEEDRGETYFKKVSLVDRVSGRELEVDDLSALAGRLIIKGESGIGKSMLLRYLINCSSRHSIFIRADQCKGDMIEAFTTRMLGMAKEDSFIHSLLYNGYLDVYIDGINEVEPDTRIKIYDLISIYKKCHFFVTTQPIDWDAPVGSVVLDLLPLKESAIYAFLISRFSIITTGSIQKKKYEEHCKNFLVQNLGKLTTEQKVFNEKILSNPFDLTIVAHLIASSKGGHIDPLRLQVEYFEQMKGYYETVNVHKSEGFPLQKFSECVFQLRLADDPRLPWEDFKDELSAMHRFKMVVVRVHEADKDEWFFRHDKIRDFFMLQTFLINKERQAKYIADVRVRGVYFLLVNFLPLDEADVLERILISYMVDTNDDYLSKEFIKLLRDRKGQLPVQKI